MEELDEIERAFNYPREARSPDYRLTVMSINYKPVRVDDAAIYAKQVLMVLLLHKCIHG